MALAIVLTLWAAVFPVQLYLCFRGKKMWIKIIPLILVAVHIVCCLTSAFLTGTGHVQPDGQLAALIALFLGLYLLAAECLAWLIWGIVRLSKNRKNNL